MPAAPSQSGQSDNSMGLLWISVALVIAGVAIWHFFRVYIIDAFFHIKIFEIKIINLFTTQLNKLKDEMDWMIQNKKLATVTFDQLQYVGDQIGYVIRWPVIIILVGLGVVVYFGNATRNFKRTYTMKTLLGFERKNWPQTSPILKLDLAKEDINKGPWAMSKTPMQFAKQNNLLEEYKPIKEDQLQSSMRVEVKLDKGQTNKTFTMQLGKTWQGVQSLNPHTKGLFAIFAARVNHDQDAANKMLKQINESSIGKLDFSGADALCKKYENTKLVQKIIHSHAYLLTVMASLLKQSREGGVLASADFLWLKPIDRRLWYMLNSVGRQTPFVEVAGPFAHWLAEMSMGRPFVTPMVDEATVALEIALKEIIYNPEEE